MGDAGKRAREPGCGVSESTKVPLNLSEEETHHTRRMKTMILLKSCPRCHGDMLEEELLGEVEIACLQCGHRTYPEAIRHQAAAPVSVAKKAA
jgi:hypothetical protein